MKNMIYAKLLENSPIYEDARSGGGVGEISVGEELHRFFG